MKKIELEKFGQIADKKDEFMEEEFIVNLEKCEMKERIKIMDFLSGFTFKGGKLEKLNKDEFLVSFK